VDVVVWCRAASGLLSHAACKRAHSSHGAKSHQSSEAPSRGGGFPGCGPIHAAHFSLSAPSAPLLASPARWRGDPVEHVSGLAPFLLSRHFCRKPPQLAASFCRTAAAEVVLVVGNLLFWPAPSFFIRVPSFHPAQPQPSLACSGFCFASQLAWVVQRGPGSGLRAGQLATKRANEGTWKGGLWKWKHGTVRRTVPAERLPGLLRGQCASQFQQRVPPGRPPVAGVLLLLMMMQTHQTQTSPRSAQSSYVT